MERELINISFDGLKEIIHEVEEWVKRNNYHGYGSRRFLLLKPKKDLKFSVEIHPHTDLQSITFQREPANDCVRCEGLNLRISL